MPRPVVSAVVLLFAGLAAAPAAATQPGTNGQLA
jgi:hypothetical protein